MEVFQALEAIWAARWPILEGVGNTLFISALSILFGTLLGVGVGLLLTYGNRAVRFIVRIFALTLFCSSHVGEIVRGALLALPRGQTEAAKSIGLTFPTTFFSVLLPQALRQILPTWVNTATEIVKASTLLSIIGVVELLLSVQQVISRTYFSLELYFFAGFVFFLINFAIEKTGRFFERKVAIPT